MEEASRIFTYNYNKKKKIVCVSPTIIQCCSNNKAHHYEIWYKDIPKGKGGGTENKQEKQKDNVTLVHMEFQINYMSFDGF